MFPHQHIRQTSSRFLAVFAKSIVIGLLKTQNGQFPLAIDKFVLFRINRGRCKSHAPPSTVSQVILYKLSIVFAQFQHVGYFIEAHPTRHEFFDIFQQVSQSPFCATFRSPFFAALIRQFFYDTAHTAHFLVCVFVFCHFVDKDVIVHIFRISTEEIIHDRPDRVIPPILPVHINDMRFVLERLRQFTDHTVHMIKRQFSLEIIVLRYEDYIRLRQILQIIARLGHIGIQHRTVVTLWQRAGVFALDFDVVNLPRCVMCRDVQPHQSAAQVLERILCLHPRHGQIVILQDRTHQKLRAIHILEHDAHERIIDQAKLLNLVIIAILTPQFGLIHLHCILAPSQSFYILYREIVCVSSSKLLNVYAPSRIFGPSSSSPTRNCR